jgi:putative cell wall-binding protein
VVRTELSRLRPARIVVVGGKTMVSDPLDHALDGYTIGDVTRQAGADRFATAAVISANAFPQASTVYVANGF